MDNNNHDDDYYWSKNQRPSPEKDHIRNEIASICMAHLKTQATVMKTIHVDPSSSSIYRTPEDLDLTPYLVYSLNKRRRWEAHENIGIDVLESARKLNQGSDTLLLERVNLRSWVGNLYNYGFAQERFLDYFMVRSVRRFNKDGGYEESELNSILGQRYSHFVKENRRHDRSAKEGKVEDAKNLVAYNFLRAPDNYVELLQKGYQSSNFGWEWPHHRYWRRVELLKDNLLWLRYGEFEDMDSPSEGGGQVEDVTDSNDKDLQGGGPSKFYNLEDHVIDRKGEEDDGFVIVKKKGKGRKQKTGF